MTMMYSPIGGWQDTPPGEIADMKKKGWFLDGEEGFVSPKAKLLQPKPDAGPLPVAEWKEESLEELRSRWQEKHGKKPHHLKSRKTLLAEI